MRRHQQLRGRSRTASGFKGWRPLNMAENSDGAGAFRSVATVVVKVCHARHSLRVRRMSVSMNVRPEQSCDPEEGDNDWTQGNDAPVRRC